jgi:hypothetical protein
MSAANTIQSLPAIQDQRALMGGVAGSRMRSRATMLKLLASAREHMPELGWCQNQSPMFGLIGTDTEAASGRPEGLAVRQPRDP